ncbi:MAG: stage II sporulation protein P [Clostridia bacterium]|nr:stage II sporulation protein P [Clostridia bacterium]
MNRKSYRLYAGGTDAIKRGVRLGLGLIFVAVTVLSPWWLSSDALLPATKRIAMLSANAIIPPCGIESASAPSAAQTVSGADAAQITTTAAPTTTTTAPTTTTTAAKTESKYIVAEKALSGGNVSSGNVYVKNGTTYDVDIDSVLSKAPECKIKLNAGYQVLIIHTHTTECYAQRTDGTYDPNYSPRSTDKSKNVVAVGDVIAAKLEAVGIRTLHVTTAHDYPQYNGSYARAEETIAAYLEQYPSIEMVIDVHRDSMTQDSGTKIKPTAVVNGKKAAQVMIISGCDAGGSLYFPEWRLNLRMGMRLQKKLSDTYPGLMRPLYFAPYRYNMHMTKNSLLIEFGTDVNTLEEALYSAEMVGEGLAGVLLDYVVG